MNQSIKTSEYERELVNLTKLYSDETKYNEENDNFSFKLTMFNDMCDLSGSYLLILIIKVRG